MICSVCGCTYQTKDAKIEFNSYFMNSLEFDFDYETEFTEPICGSCAIDYVENGMQNSLKDEDREEYAAAADAFRAMMDSSGKIR